MIQINVIYYSLRSVLLAAHFEYSLLIVTFMYVHSAAYLRGYSYSR